MTDAVKMAIERLNKWLEFAGDKPGQYVGTTSVANDDIRTVLAALEQAGEPVADRQVREIMVPQSGSAMQNGPHAQSYGMSEIQRLGQEFDAGEGISEAEALALREPNDDDRAVAENIYKAQRDRGAFCSSEVAALIASYRAMVTLDLAHPPQSRGQAFDGEGEAAALRIGWWNDMRRRGVSQENAILAINAALSSVKRGKEG